MLIQSKQVLKKCFVTSKPRRFSYFQICGGKAKSIWGRLASSDAQIKKSLTILELGGIELFPIWCATLCVDPPATLVHNNLDLYREIHSSWSSNHFSFDFISDKVIMHIFIPTNSQKYIDVYFLFCSANTYLSPFCTKVW